MPKLVLDEPIETKKPRLVLDEPIKEKPVPELRALTPELKARLRELTPEEKEILRKRKNIELLKKYPATLDAFFQGVLPIRPKKDLPPGLEEAHPFATAAGRLVGLIGMGEVSGGIAPLVSGAKILQNLPTIAKITAGKMAQTGVTFGAKELIDNIAKIVAGNKLNTKKAVEDVLKSVTFGAGVGGIGAIPQPLLRIPSQIGYGFFTAKIEGATNLEAGVRAGIFGLFGLFNTKNLNHQYKLYALQGARQALADKLVQFRGYTPEKAQALSERFFTYVISKSPRGLAGMKTEDFDKLAQAVRRGWRIYFETPTKAIIPTESPVKPVTPTPETQTVIPQPQSVAPIVKPIPTQPPVVPPKVPEVPKPTIPIVKAEPTPQEVKPEEVKPIEAKPEIKPPLTEIPPELQLTTPKKLKEVKDWLINKLDIEYPLKEIGAPKTGLALKTYLSKRVAGEEKSLKAIEDLGKFKLNPADYNKLAFIAEKPSLFVTLPEAQRKIYSPAYHYIRNYFDNYFKLLKERIPEKFELPWPQSHIRRLQEENLHLKVAIERAKNYSKAQELKKRYDENKELINFYKTSKIQYVHLPIRLWLGEKFTRNPQLAKKLISADFKAIIGRKTPTLEHFVQAGLIERGEVDIRDIMASYGRYVENQLAQKDILNMAIQEGLAKLEGEAPDDWINLPTRIAPVLKGYKLHPAFADILEQYFNTLFTSKGNIGRIMASIKMMQFYNPFFLPMYDVVQAGMLGSITYKYPKYLWQAIKDTAKKTPEYFRAAEEGLFSQPYANPFSEFMKQVEFVKQQQNNNGNYILEAINKLVKDYKLGLRPDRIVGDIYNVSWNIAWFLDKVVRMASRNYLIDKLGLSPMEASQLAAKFHSDYASVPPQTRKMLNKIFFTPVFEISMNKVYLETIKNVCDPKVLASFRKGMSGTEEEKIKKVYARALVLVAGILFGKDALMTGGLGFKREQFSRRYYKVVNTEDGEKEVVLTFANPANIWLRYYWKFKADEAETNYLMRTAKTLFSRVHPVYRIAVEVIRNEGDDFKPVYNPFDDPQYQVIDILKYVTAKSIRISEGFIKGEEVYTKQTQQALTNATNKLWTTILRPITFRYLRNIKDRREAYQIKNLVNEFERIFIREPDMDETKYQRRLENYLKRLEKISGR